MQHIRLTAAALLAVTLLAICGCGEPSLDSPEYGEIIYKVPSHLDKAYPLPQLESPAVTAAPGPQAASEDPVDEPPAK